MTNKISLTEKLIRSLGREEKNISNIIQNIDFQIDELENHLVKLKNQLIKRLQYLYMHGRQGALETILSSSNWNSAIYKIKYLDILSKYEQKLRKEMNETLNALDLKKTKRKNELNQKNNLLKEKKKENNKLEDDKKSRNKILNVIKIEKNNIVERVIMHKKSKITSDLGYKIYNEKLWTRFVKKYNL